MKRNPVAAAGLFSTALIACLATVGLARAEIDAKSKSPIDITANQAEVSNSRCVAIWRGAAEAVQGDSRLLADTITIHSKSKGGDSADKTAGGCGAAERIEADGHVFYLTPDRSARGDHAVYLQSGDSIILTGQVIVVQGQNVARGDRLTINTSTKEAVMDAASTGAGARGRVRAVYYPEKDKPAVTDKSPAAAAVPPKP